MSPIFGNQSGTNPDPDEPQTNGTEGADDTLGQDGNPSPDKSPALKTSDVQSTDDGKTPNVILSKEREGEAVPEGLTNIGTVGIVLPSVEEQMSGFYLPQELASRLVSQFRQYKFLVDKGQATPAVRIGE